MAMMKFKVGDRVKIVGGYIYIPDGAYGEYGRIQFVDECDTEIPYYVKLDKKVEGKFGCWATEKDLEAINELAEKEKEDKANI